MIAHAYEDGVAATFFFYRFDLSRNNGFPTIAWQLAFSNPDIKNVIAHALDKSPHLPEKDVKTQFKQLVAQPFHPTNNTSFQMPHPAPVVIIQLMASTSVPMKSFSGGSSLLSGTQSRTVLFHYVSWSAAGQRP
ncbi:hypothetical protein JOM56_011272 [Amanita muscaria]